MSTQIGREQGAEQLCPLSRVLGMLQCHGAGSVSVTGHMTPLILLDPTRNRSEKYTGTSPEWALHLKAREQANKGRERSKRLPWEVPPGGNPGRRLPSDPQRPQGTRRDTGEVPLGASAEASCVPTPRCCLRTPPVCGLKAPQGSAQGQGRGGPSTGLGTRRVWFWANEGDRDQVTPLSSTVSSPGK